MPLQRLIYYRIQTIQMQVEPIIFDIARIACSGVIIVVAAYYIVKTDVDRYLKIKAAQYRNTDSQYVLSLRLQAHERLILFAERINPANLLLAVHDKALSKAGMQAVLLEQIRAEYQHNVSQQLYVSGGLWQTVLKLKEDTIALVNNVSRTLPEDASGTDLGRQILIQLAGIDEAPYAAAQELIRKHIHKVYSYE